MSKGGGTVGVVCDAGACVSPDSSVVVASVVGGGVGGVALGVACCSPCSSLASSSPADSPGLSSVPSFSVVLDSGGGTVAPPSVSSLSSLSS